MKHEPKKDPKAWVTERHNYWYGYLRNWCLHAGINPPLSPRCETVIDGYKKAGWYSQGPGSLRSCTYDLAYVIVAGERYDETIAHEMCHAFQRTVANGKTHKHGEIFFFLLNVVCKIPRGKFHNYDCNKAKAIAKIMNMQVKISACTGK